MTNYSDTSFFHNAGEKLAGIEDGATANDTDANLKSRANHTGTQAASTISDFNSAADARITAQKGQNSGLAPLDSGGKVAAAYLPSYVDDVLEYANFAALPGTGETGKIYTTLNNNKIFRWSGSAYVEIAASPGSTDSVTEGSTNLYFTAERAQDAIGSALSADFVYDDAGNGIKLRDRTFPAASRSTNTAFQISADRDADVTYKVPVTSAATLLVGSRATGTLQYADNSGMSTNLVSIDSDDFGIGSGLVVTGYGTLKLNGKIPKGKWVRIVTAASVGSPTIGGTATGQESLL